MGWHATKIEMSPGPGIKMQSVVFGEEGCWLRLLADHPRAYARIADIAPGRSRLRQGVSGACSCDTRCLRRSFSQRRMYRAVL